MQLVAPAMCAEVSVAPWHDRSGLTRVGKIDTVSRQRRGLQSQ